MWEILRTPGEDTHPVYLRFGTWVLTTYGLECLCCDYPVPWTRLRETDWWRHISAKTWCTGEVKADLWAALSAVRQMFVDRADTKGSNVSRWKVLERDAFACRACGATGNESTLEVDHFVPRSRGGSDHELNLMTLCKRCNTSKNAFLR